MPDENQRLEESEVATALGISVETLRRLIEAQDFPDRIWITDRTGYWVQKDIDTYLYLRTRVGKKKSPVPVTIRKGSGGGQEGVTEGS